MTFWFNIKFLKFNFIFLHFVNSFLPRKCSLVPAKCSPPPLPILSKVFPPVEGHWWEEEERDHTSYKILKHAGNWLKLELDDGLAWPGQNVSQKRPQRKSFSSDRRLPPAPLNLRCNGTPPKWRKIFWIGLGDTSFVWVKKNEWTNIKQTLWKLGAD